MSNADKKPEGTPIPPGAKLVEVEVKDPPKAAEEKPGVMARLWAFIKEAPGKVSNGIRWGIGWTVGKVYDGLSWVNSKVVDPVFSRIERWVPFTGRIRAVLPWYGLGLLLTGAVVGALVAAQVGAGLLGTLALIGYGIVLVPWIIATTPSLWLLILRDLWIISAILIVFEAAAAWLVGAPFFRTLAQLAFPGWYDLATREKEEEEEEAVPAKA